MTQRVLLRRERGHGRPARCASSRCPVVPQLRLYGFAALAFVALTLGAVLTHLIWGASPVPAIVLLVVSAVIAWGRRSNTADLIAGLLRR